MSSLKQKSVSGVIWAFTEKVSVTGVKFILGIVMARLLTPDDFGLIGMITIFLVISEVFVESGFAMAYIQKKQINDADADTVFYTNLIISLILFCILFILAPVISKFYNQPQLIELTRVLGLVIIINAFNIIQRAQIIRNVSFKKLTKVTLFSSLLSGAFGIGAAFFGMGVWALVIQSLASRFFIGIGLWYNSDYRPRLRFSKKSFTEMFSFGSWMLFSNIVRTFFDNIYLLAIGKFFPVAQLGFYTKAKQLAQLSTNQIAQAIGSVAFPVYASLQDDKEKLQRAMQRFIKHSMFFIIPLIIFLIVVAEPLIIILLTEKWATMIPYFQIICLAGLLYPMNQINAQSIIALGKGSISFYFELGRNAMRLINILITLKLGIIYMLFGEVLISIIFFFINGWFNNKYTGYGVLNQVKDIYKILVGGIFSALLAIYISSFFHNNLLLLMSGFLVTISSYLLIEYLINKELVISTVIIFKNLLKK